MTVHEYTNKGGNHLYVNRHYPKWWNKPIAKLKLWWCKRFHRRRSYGMPTAGKDLLWPIDCMVPGCDCSYEVVTPNTPQHTSPFTVDTSKPKTYGEWDR